MEKYIVKKVGEILHSQDVSIVKRLEGGMSNYTYVVLCDGKKYTYRVPGKNAEVFVNRTDELSHIKAVEPLQLNNETVYFDIQSGEKLAKYVEGTILSETDVAKYDARSAETLHKLHRSQIALKPYDAFSRLDYYESLCKGRHFQHPEQYTAFRNQLNGLRRQYQQERMVPCHCDYQPTNLVIGSDRLYVLDWEFAGMNDPYYDIACYGNVSIENAISLLAAYLDHQPDQDELNRLFYHRTYQCLQWYNVAEFKHMIGLSKELLMDFSQVADIRV